MLSVEQRRRSFSTPGYLEPHQATFQPGAETSQPEVSVLGPGFSQAEVTPRRPSSVGPRVLRLGSSTPTERIRRSLGESPIVDRCRSRSARGTLTASPVTRGAGVTVLGRRRALEQRTPTKEEGNPKRRKIGFGGNAGGLNPVPEEELLEHGSTDSVVASPAWLAFEAVVRQV